MPTYLGMPPFPEAAKAALADSQFRHNLAHATGVIRASCRPSTAIAARSGRYSCARCRTRPAGSPTTRRSWRSKPVEMV